MNITQTFNRVIMSAR